MNLTSGRKVAFALGAVALVLLASAWISYRNTRQLDDDARWVVHTHEVLEATETLLGTVVDAETGQRGFLLTGDNHFLEPYDQALENYAQELESLRTLTNDNIRQQVRIQQLAGLIEQRFAILAQLLKLHQEGDPEAVKKAIRVGEGKQVMDKIRVVFEEIAKDERLLLRDRESIRQNAYFTAVFSSVLSLVAGLTAIGAAAWFVNRTVRERGRADTARQQKALIHSIIAGMGDGVIVTDIHGHVTMLNRVAEQLTEWTEETAIGRTVEEIFKIVNIDTRVKVLNPARQAMIEGRVVLLEPNSVLIGKGGTEWPVDDSAAPIMNDQGVAIGSVLVFREITERHKAERTLAETSRRRDELLAAVQESEGYLRSVLDNSPDCIKVLDLDGKLLDMNRPGRCAMDIDSFDPLRGADWPTIWPEAGRNAARSAVESARRGEVARFEGPCPTAKGIAKLWDVRVAPIPGQDGKPSRLVCVSRDVTAEKTAHDALQESEQRFQSFMENAPALAFVKDEEGRFVFVNGTTCRRFKIPEADWIGRTDAQLFGNDVARSLREVDKKVLASGENAKVMESVPTPDQKSQFWQSYKFRLLGRDGKHYLAGMSVDVTAETRVGIALKESEEKFRCVVDGLAEGVCVLDLETMTVIEANGTFLRLLSYQSDEIVKLCLYDFMNVDRNMIDRELKQNLDHGQFKLGRRQVRRKDGTAVDVDVSVSHIITGERRMLAVVVRDMSEQLAAEDRLFEYQLELEEANTKLRSMAVTDGLTGVKNRSAFNSKLAEEYDRAVRYRHPLSVVLMDVDYFKLFNDAFGHPAGDEVLKGVASTLRDTARTMDFVARYGGEEFVVILPDTDYSGAMVVAERFRRAIANGIWEKRAITISVGVATLSETTENAETLVQEADNALYLSKKAGRNRVSYGSRILQPVTHTANEQVAKLRI